MRHKLWHGEVRGKETGSGLLVPNASRQEAEANIILVFILILIVCIYIYICIYRCIYIYVHIYMYRVSRS